MASTTLESLRSAALEKFADLEFSFEDNDGVSREMILRNPVRIPAGEREEMSEHFLAEPESRLDVRYVIAGLRCAASDKDVFDSFVNLVENDSSIWWGLFDLWVAAVDLGKA